MQNLERQQDLLSQLSDIQRKLQSGNVDEALKQLDKLGQDLERLEKSLAQRAQDEQGGQYSEEAQKLAQAAQKLRDIATREKALENRTGQLRREMGAQAQKRFDQRGGKELAKKLREKVEQARQGVKQIDSKLAERMGLEDVLEAAQSRVDDLSRALESGDFSEALEQAERSLRAVETLQARLGMEEQLAQRYPGFVRDPDSVRRGMKGAQAAAPPLRDVVSELEQAIPRGEPLSPQQMQELMKQQAEQRQIGEDLQQARNQLGDVGRKVPIFGPQHEQMLQQAQEGMGRAEQRLGQGEPRGAQAGEQQAIEQLQKFEDAMQQLAKQAGGKGRSGPRMPMPWGEPGGDEGEDDSGDMDTRKVEIPDAEASRGPQEFRKELLDAMKQKAPEKYQERVKQYYEELVK
jgi:myosin heavy subunit